MVYFIRYGSEEDVEYNKLQLQVMCYFEKLEITSYADVYLSIEFKEQSGYAFSDVATCKLGLNQNTGTIDTYEVID